MMGGSSERKGSQNYLNTPEAAKEFGIDVSPKQPVPDVPEDDASKTDDELDAEAEEADDEDTDDETEEEEDADV